jgi:glycosyltransferase involved in cell wall biosynthesis
MKKTPRDPKTKSFRRDLRRLFGQPLGAAHDLFANKPAPGEGVPFPLPAGRGGYGGMSNYFRCLVLKIAYVTPAKPGDQRAWSGLSHHMAQSLISAGLKVELIHTLVKPPLLWPFRLQTYLTHKARLTTRHLWLYDPRVARAYAGQVERALQQSKADVVFSSGTVQIAYLKSSRPIVFWNDATFAALVDYYFSKNDINASTLRNGHATERAAIHNSSLGLYASSWAADSALTQYQADPQRIHVLPFGANLTREPRLDEVFRWIDARPSQPCRLFFLGVDWERKGGPAALALAESLTRKGLPCELTIAGCAVPPNVKLPGYAKAIGFIEKGTAKGDALLEKLFAESHFLLVPSRAECFGLVFAEANAYGVPVLALATGGVPSVVLNNINGFCPSLEGNFLGELEQHVLSLMKNREKYRNLARSSRQEYEKRLNWKVSGEKIRELIEKLL